ncbi:trifunctional serine/threonine-protein kinase/ATP-binding protein/sensor histidine kinase [Archangium sp.]|uniref:trifunctional serine/threonine-protein kinase/ATP-binding protein/sensor histidine kinase n=1 Tax=Archangium sp. TaxID=1872627 RepID=UPI002D31DEF7|nr:AAA family ATPase [Archangium sp.]HYO53325.1 AAA family ATPase [Archangium sp.]
MRRPREEYPSPEQLARLRYGYELSAQLNLPGVVNVLELTRQGNSLVVVMEDFGGRPLRNLLGAGPLPVQQALRIALRVAKTLGELHGQRVVHKDVTPSNILVNGQTGEVKLANFDIASRLAAETSGPTHPHGLNGELAYISPEQTGRMNRGVDYRSDFYSLGVTLYEMLTGQVPFTDKDSISLVYSHLAVEPLPPDQLRPELPPTLSAMVMKLLAKNAEERYQSAYGLVADLEECLTQLEASGTVADFQPGRNDVSATFLIPQKLYGREQDTARLLATFERVSQGASAELLLISGYSGVGKSSLVNKVQRPLLRLGGHFGSGKFDQFQNAPYKAWIEAFDGIIRQTLSEREERISACRERLLDALGTNGRVVTDVIPQLALIIGPQPPVPTLGPTEAQARFSLVFQRFIGALASQDNPLVLFLDDLQWADAASLVLLQRILSNPDCRHLLLIGAYRDNEIYPGHGLHTLLADLQKTAVTLSRVALSPLSLEDVRELLTDTLHCQGDPQVAELASLVFQKTQGNPFFVNQFVSSLHGRGLLDFEPERGRWRWSLEQIRKEDITDNVITLMIQKLARLPAGTQEVLKRAACIGKGFNLETLSVIGERSPHQTNAALWEAVQEGLLLPLDEAYKYIQGDGSNAGPGPSPAEVRYEFLHDRVREAAYTLISEDSRKQLHLSIGRLLLERTPEERREAVIFDLVNQLNPSIELIQNPEERLELARLNLVAGKRAKASSAYAAALEYIRTGTALLPEDGWERAHELSFALHRHRIECHHLLGQFDEVEQGFSLVLARTRTPMELQELYCLKLDLDVSRGRFLEAIQPAYEGLKVLGIHLPEPHEEAAVGAAIVRESERLQANLAGRSTASLVDLPETHDPMERARLQLLVQALSYSGYLYPQLYWLMVLTMVNRTLENGYARGAAIGFCQYALALGSMTGDFKQAYEFGQLSLALCERFNDAVDLARCRMVCAFFINPWTQPLKDSMPLLDLTFQGLKDNGMLFWAGLSSMQIAMAGLLTGEELGRQMERTQRHVDFYRRSVDQHQQAIYPVGAAQNIILRLMRGPLPPDSPPWHLEAEVVEKIGNPGVVVIYRILCMRLAYVMEDYALAQEYLAKVEPMLHTTHGWVIQVEVLLYQGLLKAELHRTASHEDQARYEQFIDEAVEKLRGLGALCAENFLPKYRLLAAERARMAGRDAEALALYDEAIAAAIQGGNTHEEALANELAGRLQLARGRKKVAQAYLEEARYAYTRWGALAKVDALARRHPELLRPAGSGQGAGNNPADGLDLITVLKASQAISQEIVLHELLRKLMSIIVENAGARRGLLFLQGDRPLIVEAWYQESGGTTVVVHEAKASDRTDLPLAIVRYVERTGERVVLREAASDGPFQADPDVAQLRPRSVLCMPVVKQNTAVGTLYLENNLVADAFTPARCQVLDLLSSQAAISLENAQLYDTLEQRVRERTRELHVSNEGLSQALRQLREAQAQLVMKEKLASLGALASGIAHEIKNPINFINNFALLSSELVEELCVLVESQRERLEVQYVSEVNGLATDIRANVSKINEHGRRADSIVRSMLELSHNNGGSQSEVNLNDLVSEFTHLAIHGSRTRNPDFTVTIEKDFDAALKPLTVMSQELGRVILNLVNNACYALDMRRKTAGADFTPRLQVSTREFGDGVEIRVRDNGTGIPANIQGKIFNPFFTTKPAGQGTGLGLSLSHEIIVQGHGGTLQVDSREGLYAEFIIRLPRREHAASTGS